MEIAKEFRFEASHVLPNHPGKCSNLHGHSWKLTVAVEDKINEETGMVLDYSELKKQVQPIIDDLDHSHLGAWKTDKVIISNIRLIESGVVKKVGIKFVEWLPNDDSFNPTSENLILAIGVEMWKRNIKFDRMMLEETTNTACYLEWPEVFRYIKQKGITK